MPGGIEEGISDFWPTWHAKTGVLLGTGHTIRYLDDTLPPLPRPRDTAYSVYDPRTRQWSPFRKLETPDDDLFFMDGAGSTQRVDLENGDILLPTYTGLPNTAKGRFTFQGIAFVMRCSFDGQTLRYVEHGDTLTMPTGRGGTRNTRLSHVLISKSAQRESNPHFRHGKAAGCRYIMGAWLKAVGSRIVKDLSWRCRIQRAPGGTRTLVAALRKRCLRR